ncbi:MAG: hypothetical protein SVO26_02695, partial [Chloroflexota bacterium]|nr:hypothetical protein [Chloroflexota bacterium]
EFPTMIQHLSWIAPLTSVTDLMRAVISGSPGDGSWWSLAIMVGIIIIFFPLSLLRMKRRLLK